jgi:hypothetical protein
MVSRGSVSSCDRELINDNLSSCRGIKNKVRHPSRHIRNRNNVYNTSLRHGVKTVEDGPIEMWGDILHLWDWRFVYFSANLFCVRFRALNAKIVSLRAARLSLINLFPIFASLYFLKYRSALLDTRSILYTGKFLIVVSTKLSGPIENIIFNSGCKMTCLTIMATSFSKSTVYSPGRVIKGNRLVV